MSKFQIKTKNYIQSELELPKKALDKLRIGLRNQEPVTIELTAEQVRNWVNSNPLDNSNNFCLHLTSRQSNMVDSAYEHGDGVKLIFSKAQVASMAHSRGNIDSLTGAGSIQPRTKSILVDRAERVSVTEKPVVQQPPVSQLPDKSLAADTSDSESASELSASEKNIIATNISKPARKIRSIKK